MCDRVKHSDATMNVDLNEAKLSNAQRGAERVKPDYLQLNLDNNELKLKMENPA